MKIIERLNTAVEDIPVIKSSWYIRYPIAIAISTGIVFVLSHLNENYPPSYKLAVGVCMAGLGLAASLCMRELILLCFIISFIAGVFYLATLNPIVAAILIGACIIATAIRSRRL